jgi:hypothetical protein
VDGNDARLDQREQEERLEEVNGEEGMKSESVRAGRAPPGHRAQGQGRHAHATRIRGVEPKSRPCNDSQTDVHPRNHGKSTELN